MKIVYKPLQNLDKTSNKTVGSTKGTFKDMLTRHLKVARGQAPAPNPSATSGNLTTNVDKTSDQDQGMDTLKGMDEEYFKKGVKKKTLAATFSSRNSSKLDERIKKYRHLIEAKAKKHGLDPNLLAGLIRQESNFNPYAVSYCGAMGLGQLMPETARYLGVTDPFNASQNLDAAAKYLKEQLNTFGGNVNKALAAYNAGPGAVKRFRGIPPYRETRNYVRSINSHYTQIAKLNLFKKKGV